ncbi:MAG: hypothetical protein WBA76_09790 [Phormidesmis sp.]
MSDTTAYLAGCATTGVAALVLLVARVGMAGSEGSRVRQLDDRLAQVEATATPSSNAAPGEARLANQNLDYEIRSELNKQQELTKKLEAQLAQQETLSGSLKEQLKSQDEKTQSLVTKIQDYQRSVEDIEIDGKIAAASRPADSAVSATPTTLILLGAGVVVVLLIGGGGLILCAVLLILQSQRRSARSAPMPPPMPMPPAAPYRYYDQTFLPPAQLRPRRSDYYDYPPSPYDYTP